MANIIASVAGLSRFHFSLKIWCVTSLLSVIFTLPLQAQTNRSQRITLNAVQEKSGAVLLTWTIENPANNETLRLYRATNLGAFQIFGSFQLIQSMLPQQTGFLDNMTRKGMGYRYYLETVSASTPSLPSNLVEINPMPAPASGVFVAPNGTATNTGTINSPLNLVTALASNSHAQAGMTIWLRSGLYSLPGAILSGTEESPFRATLNGHSGMPITIRSYPGEWAIINGGIRVDGNDLVFRDFEITNTSTNRDLARPTGMTVLGKRIKLINLIIHDTGNAMGLWNAAEDTEVYGNVLYRNGWEGPNDFRGNGHGLYIQNQVGTKTIRDNFSFDNYATGMKAYGEATAISGVTFDGNITFNNGSLARPRPDNNRIDNMFVGSKLGAEKIIWTNNLAYHPLTARGTSIRLGYLALTNKDVILRDNYFVGGTTSLAYLTRWNQVTLTGNTFIADRELISLNTPSGQSIGTYQWDNNRFFARDETRPFTYGVNNGGAGYSLSQWSAITKLDLRSQWMSATNGRPVETQITVRKNQYENGRAHIAVVNWSLQPTVTLSAAQLAGILRAGDTYVIQNVQALKGTPVSSGTFDGINLSLPLRGGTLGLEFNAFLLLRTGTQTFTATTNAKTSLRHESLDEARSATTIESTPSAEIQFPLDEVAARVIEKLNEFRQAHNLPLLNLSLTLCQASKWSAQDMAQREEASTIDSLGRNAMQRARAFGFPGTLATLDESEWSFVTDENEYSVIAHLTSASSNQGLTSMSEWKAVGIACAISSKTGQRYWSVIFGGLAD